VHLDPYMSPYNITDGEHIHYADWTMAVGNFIRNGIFNDNLKIPSIQLQFQLEKST
jgi:hypothetical protein